MVFALLLTRRIANFFENVTIKHLKTLSLSLLKVPVTFYRSLPHTMPRTGVFVQPGAVSQHYWKAQEAMRKLLANLFKVF